MIIVKCFQFCCELKKNPKMRNFKLETRTTAKRELVFLNDCPFTNERFVRTNQKMIRARNKLQLFTCNLFIFKYNKNRAFNVCYFISICFVSFFIVLRCCLIGFIVSFVCASFFVTFHRNERDFILIFHSVYLRDFHQHSKLWSSNLERKKLSLCLCFFSTHREKLANIHTLVHMHMYSSSSSYISNVEFHLYVFQFLHFHFIRSMCRCSFLSRCPCLFMTNVCHFYFLHIFSFISSVWFFFQGVKKQQSQYNFHSIHSYTLNMCAQVERKSLLFWQQGTFMAFDTHSQINEIFTFGFLPNKFDDFAMAFVRISIDQIDLYFIDCLFSYRQAPTFALQ